MFVARERVRESGATLMIAGMNAISPARIETESPKFIKLSASTITPITVHKIASKATPGAGGASPES